MMLNGVADTRQTSCVSELSHVKHSYYYYT